MQLSSKVSSMKKWRYVFYIGAIMFFLLSIKAYSLFRATWPIAIPYWQESNESSQERLDHNQFNRFLATYLTNGSELHTVHYQQVTDSDKQKLTDYLAYLQTFDPRRLNKNEQLAYWINLYNGLIINMVLNHYPITSVRKIGDGFTGPWNIEQATIAGKTVSLNQIEHGILRPIWQDNRIHYVINCASIGCPDLPLTVFSSENIDQQLNSAAIRFVNQSKGVNLVNNQLILSSIYKWFSDDFGETSQDTLNHIKRFAHPSLKSQLDSFSGDITYDYDWGLNAAKTNQQ